MKSILFASDLDNTLIHSKAHRQDGDECVEYIDGMPQSYMSPETIQRLREIVSLAEFVPVTTRSVEQYLRIQWPEGCKPRYSLTTNGTILLCDGTPAESWLAASEAVACRYSDQMERMRTLLLKSELFDRCRVVDGMFLFARTAEGVDFGEHLKKYDGITELRAFYLGRKVYFFPPDFYKGAGIGRLKAELDFEKTIVAGDSDMDITLFDFADLGVAPKGLEKHLSGKKGVIICPEEEIFSEYVTAVTLSSIRGHLEDGRG